MRRAAGLDEDDSLLVRGVDTGLLIRGSPVSTEVSMIKILLSLGSWELRHGDPGLGYYVAHVRCPTTLNQDSTRSMAWISGDVKPRCFGCYTPVPDEIQALIALLT